MSPDTAASVDAVVLAAGLSSRMGGFKPLLPLGEGSVLARVVETLRKGGAREVVVVCGHEEQQVRAEACRLGARAVSNPDYPEGMFSSIRTGFSALAGDCAAALLLPVDVPLVREWTVKSLIRSFREEGAALLHPVFLGQRGHPPLISRRLFQGILEHQGQGGLRSFLEAHERELPASVRDVAVPDAGVLQDMDSDADYARVLELHAGLGAPTPEECEALFEEQGTPERARRHCRAVARVAVALARALSNGLDLTLVERAALVHDLAKGRPFHEEEGGRLLEERGFAAVAGIVAAHRDIILGGDAQLGEREAVFLADKMVMGDRLVPLEQRYGEVLRRHGHDPAARDAILGRLSRAQEVYRRATLQASLRAGNSVLLHDVAARALALV